MHLTSRGRVRRGTIGGGVLAALLASLLVAPAADAHRPHGGHSDSERPGRERPDHEHREQTVRVATFNASLNRPAEGDLRRDLSTPDNVQAQAIAEIVQRNRPDVLVLQEFDHDPKAPGLFSRNYLEHGQSGADPIDYPYRFTAPVNTGVPSGFDLDKNGTVGGPGDAYGFGEFPGQYGMVVYSKHPIDTRRIRTFQKFL